MQPPLENAVVEIVCTDARTVRPVRVGWRGVVREIVALEARVETAAAWDGRVRTADGLSLELAFSRALGGWRAREIASGADGGGAAPQAEAAGGEAPSPEERLRRAALRLASRRGRGE